MIYDEIRRFSGVPYVSSLQRYLATMPGVLEWAWDALRPAMVSGVIPETAWRLADAVRLPATATTQVEDPDSIRNIAANFVRVSPVNLLMGACLRLMLTRREETNASIMTPAPDPVLSKPVLTHGPWAHDDGVGFPEVWTPVAMLPPMPGNVDPLTLPDDQRAVLMRFATELNGKPFVPALYRQIAHWPAVLAWLADTLEPLFAAPLVLQTGAAFRTAAAEAARSIVDRLPGLPAGPPPDAATSSQILGAIDRYAQTSPEMTMFGQLILDAVPART